MEDEYIFVEFEHYDFDNNKSFQSGWSSIASVIDPNRIGIEYLRAKVFFFSKYCKPLDLEKYLSWKKGKENTDYAIEQQGDVKQLSNKYNQTMKTENIAKENDGLDFSTAAVHSGHEINDVKDDTYSIENVSKNVGENNNASSDNHSKSIFDNISTCFDSMSLSQCEVRTNTRDAKIDGSGMERDYDKGAHFENVDDEKNASPGIASFHGDVQEETSLSLLEIATHIQNGIPIPGLVTVDIHPTNQEPTPSSCTRKPKPWELNVIESIVN